MFNVLKTKKPEIILILVGVGPLLKDVKNQVSLLDLRNVYFLGEREDVPDILSASDCLVFPSFYEGLPGVLLEAQINKIPVITSTCITKEVVVSNLISFLDLKASKVIWVNKTLDYLNMDREDNLKQKLDLKFDVKDSLNLLNTLYL